MKKILGTILVLTMLVSAFSILVFTTSVGAADSTVLTVNFEDSSTEGWDPYLGGTFAITTDEAHGGSKALIAQERSGGAWNSPAYNLYSAIKAKGAGTYTVKAWLYTDEDDCSIQVLVRGEAGTTEATMPSYMAMSGPNAFKGSAAQTVLQSTWTQVEYTFTVLSSDLGDDKIDTCYFCLDGFPKDYEFYIDDLTLEWEPAATPKPGQPAYQFTMAGNYVTGTEDTYIILEPVKGDILDDSTATLNVKNTGSNTFTLYLSIRNDDATWSDAIVSDDLTLAPGETGTITINNVPSTGKHPVLELKTMNANDSFIIGNFSSWGIEFTVSAGVLAPEEVDGTGIFEAVVTEAPTGGEESTADVATLGYAIAAVSGLAALIVGKKRISK